MPEDFRFVAVLQSGGNFIFFHPVWVWNVWRRIDKVWEVGDMGLDGVYKQVARIFQNGDIIVRKCVEIRPYLAD